MALAVTSRSDRERFDRIKRLINTEATAIIRGLFYHKHRPSTAAVFLQNHRATLEKLRSRQIFTRAEWNRLFPASSTSFEESKVDITLLLKLLRNICSLKTPTTGWDRLPNHCDLSLEADLARIKYHRNVKPELSENKFNALWEEIRDALSRILGYYAPDSVREWQTDVEKLRTGPTSAENTAIWLADIVHGEIIADRGSEFQAHFAEVTSTDQIDKVLDRIKKDSKYANAANIIWAYRLYDADTEADTRGSDDGGEHLAGKRLQLLLRKINATNVVVIATCWQEAECLYLDIYKNINECVLKLLMLHGQVESKTQEEIDMFLETFEAYFAKQKERIANAAYKAMKEAESETPKTEFEIIHGEVVVDRKNKFQAHLAQVTSQEQIEQILEELERDSKTAKATCNMLAYRIYVKEKKSFLEEGRDDGENRAGKRLLHLLQVSKVKDVVVIVTHWHSGVRIGSDRFKHINACAVEVIKLATEGGMIATDCCNAEPSESTRKAEKLQRRVTESSTPLEIIIRGQKACHAYEKAILHGKIQIKHLFLMCIGQSSAGKTSLLKSFKGELFDPNEDSTDGVDLQRCVCKLKDSIWVPDEGELSFESVISKNIAESYKAELKAHPDVANLHKQKKRNTYDGLTDKVIRKKAIDPEIIRRANDVLRNLDASEGSDIICSTLDIGGQPVYNVTHPLFISQKSGILLVHSLENNALGPAVPVVKHGDAKRKLPNKCPMTNMDHLEFWLSYVGINSMERGPKTLDECRLLPKSLPPVFLACTHADVPFHGKDAEEMSREILKRLKRHDHPPGKHLVSSLYPINNTVSGSTSEDEGVKKLRKEICQVAKHLPHINEDIPVRWFAFENELASLVQNKKERFLTVEEAKNVASDCKVDVDSDEFLTLLNYLHDIRVIIYFEGTQTVFIDIQWLINMIGKVITVEPFECWKEEHSDSWRKLENKGELDVSLLEHVWSKVVDDQVTVDSLLVIMQRFSLLYRWKIAGKQDVFLVPAMLMNSDARDIAELLNIPMAPLILHFPSSHLPLGIFPRLQVMVAELCNRKWPSAPQPKFYHNFCRFYDVGEDGSADLVLTSDIRTISIGVINNDEADNLKVTAFCKEILEFVKTKLGTDMRKDFPWMERMDFKLCIRCPICQPLESCSQPHVPGCASSACVHFITEEEVHKKKCLRCYKNPTLKDSVIGSEHFSHWFLKPELSSPSKPFDGGLEAVPVDTSSSIGLETVSVDTSSSTDLAVDPVDSSSSTGALLMNGTNKRWVVVGIAIMKELLPVLRSFVQSEMIKHYDDLKASDNIHTQIHGTHLKKDGTFKFNYDSINNNQGKKPPSTFDYTVKSADDLAKLYLKPFMAKFTGIDDTCDLSAVLGIISSASVFPNAAQDAAKEVREHVRNAWGHCNFTLWDEAKFKRCFELMDDLAQALNLPDDQEKKLLEQLKEWKEKGVALCLGSPVDADLLSLVHTNVAWLLEKVKCLKERHQEFERVSRALQGFNRLSKLEEGHDEHETRLTAIEIGLGYK